MNKKKVDSILKGITAAGIAMGGVSSIQGADMVMAAINESAADSNSLVDAGSLSESERTEYSESTTQSMSERKRWRYRRNTERWHPLPSRICL